MYIGLATQSTCCIHQVAYNRQSSDAYFLILAALFELLQQKRHKLVGECFCYNIYIQCRQFRVPSYDRYL